MIPCMSRHACAFPRAGKDVQDVQESGCMHMLEEALCECKIFNFPAFVMRHDEEPPEAHAHVWLRSYMHGKLKQLTLNLCKLHVC
jgi:hypothetical protein